MSNSEAVLLGVNAPVRNEVYADPANAIADTELERWRSATHNVASTPSRTAMAYDFTTLSPDDFEALLADDTAASLIRQVGYYSVWTLGLFVAAGALGFEPGNVVTGLGLTSLALGFALKDILSNFVSGLLLLLLRPFQLGDQIVIGETGSVERIELCATQIRTYDGRIVFVPNAEIFTSRVTNNTAAPIRQAKVTIPVGYDQSVGTAILTLQSAVENTPGVLAQPKVSVRLQDLTQQEIQIEMRFWTDSRRSDFAATSAAARQNAIEALKAAGISLPDPAARAVRITWGESRGGTQISPTRRA